MIELHFGDNIAVMEGMQRSGVSVHLVYADPPFNTGRDFKTRDGQHAYSDRWPSVGAYVDSLRERCVLMHKLLIDDGCLVLHCDARTSHYTKVMLDDVFGIDKFQCEIVWHVGTGAKSRTRPSLQHNTLLVYGKGRKITFNVDCKIMHEPYAEGSMLTHFRDVDTDGRRYRKRTVNGKEYVYFADVGRVVGSVWTDIPSMQATSPIMGESTGYPTQKPERLLERIISAFSNKGDVVLDPYVSSRTTLAVAKCFGRDAIGIDNSPMAIGMTAARLGLTTADIVCV